jgi:hypothetical protein
MFTLALSLLVIIFVAQEISGQAVTGVCFCVTQGSCNTGGIVNPPGPGTDGSGLIFFVLFFSISKFVGIILGQLDIRIQTVNFNDFSLI